MGPADVKAIVDATPFYWIKPGDFAHCYHEGTQMQNCYFHLNVPADNGTWNVPYRGVKWFTSFLFEQAGEATDHGDGLLYAVSLEAKADSLGGMPAAMHLVQVTRESLSKLYGPPFEAASLDVKDPADIILGRVLQPSAKWRSGDTTIQMMCNVVLNKPSTVRVVYRDATHPEVNAPGRFGVR
jgi:hypothetical protein